MLLLLVAISVYVSYAHAVLVRVKQGALKGEVVANEVDGSPIYSFKGVPYAQPPVGNLRFKAPQPITSWRDVKNATRHGAVCPQYDILMDKIIPGNENCLFLNIYSPKIDPGTSMPVMFFIHGGGFLSGSGNDDFYGPDFIVRKNVVLVTINYRLGLFGFLDLNIEEVPGNAGLKDQIMAMKWVQENIKSFGGDPNQVTIIGQSAGAASAFLHLVSPSTKGLFNRIIALSGAPTCDFLFAYQPTKRPYLLAKHLGNNSTNPIQVLEFLQRVESKELIPLNIDATLLATEAVSNDNLFRYYYFPPVVENTNSSKKYITKNYLRSVKNGNLRDIDLLLGTTNLEAVFTAYNVETALKEVNKYPELLVVREILNQVTPDTSLEIADLINKHYFGDKSISVENIAEYYQYSSDMYLSAVVRRNADLISEKLSKVYFYKFESFSNRNYFGKAAVPHGLYIASHLDDLMYIFNPKSLNLTVDINSIEFEMIELTTKIFTNFAKYGTPTPDESLGLIWPKYDPINKNYVTISNVTLIRGCNPDSSATAFRNYIFEKAGIDY